MRQLAFGTLFELLRLLRANLNAVGPDRWRLAILVLLSLLSGIVQASLFFLLATMAIAISARGPVSQYFTWVDAVSLWSPIQLVAGASLCVALALLLSIPIAQMQASIGTRAVARARNRIIDAYLNASLEYRSRLGENQLHQLIGEHCNQLATGVNHFTTFCVAASGILVLLAMPLAVSSRLAIVILVIALASLIFFGPAMRKMRRDTLERSAVNRDITRYNFQLVRLATDIELFGVKIPVSRRASERIHTACITTRRIYFSDSLITSSFFYLSLGALCAAMSTFLLVERGPRPGLAAAVLFGMRILGYTRAMLAAVRQGSTMTSHAEAIATAIAGLDQQRSPDRPVAQVEFDGLHIEGLSFNSAEGRVLFEDVDLDISRGEAVGIVGPSGEGKSSFCSLILGLMPPSAGRISTGGIPVMEIAPEAWGKIAAHVPQRCELITDTVAENIRIYREGFDDAAVEAAARAANIHDEIMELPAGYATVIGPGARGLSGGQRQRMAIARAFLGKPRFLVLDEPSSALDKISEQHLSKVLAAAKNETTLVIISHRAAVLELCDRVLTLRNGRLTPTPTGESDGFAVA